MLALALDQLAVKEDDVVLHIGFGWDLELLIRLAILLDKGRIAGIESNPAAVQRAIKIFAEEFSTFKADFRNAVVSKIPFYDGSFTKVVSLDHMHTWINLDKGFDEINRVLASDGLFVLVWGVPVHQDTQVQGRRIISPDEVTKLLKDAGFYRPELRERVVDSMKARSADEQEVVIAGTIAAIATPPGEGGVGVIRISGPEAVANAERCFRSFDLIKLSKQTPRMLQFGHWIGPQSRVLDEVLCVRFEAPHSFTGEDVVEVHSHGGAFHLRQMLKTVLGEKVRLARPGEFTQRAFINGKMDLTRAEAVADLINSGTELARDAATRQLAGGLFEAVENLRQQVIDLSAQVEAAVDFPDEEDQLLPKADLLKKVQAVRGQMQALLATAKQGRMVTQGVRVALAGRPNVGKSSLMNALLGENRSIVTEIAGTTRDYIEEKLSIQGFPVILTDTAGLRESADLAEQEGVKRSRERVAAADVLMLVLDVSKDLSAEDFSVMGHFAGDVIFVANKADLEHRWNVVDLKKYSGDAAQRFAAVSSKLLQGMDALKAKLLDVALKGRAASLLDSVVLTQSRHEEAMRRAEELIGHVEGTLSAGKLSAEFLAGDMRAALDALGEIVGTTSREDVINAIFAKFCIGK